MTQGYYVSAARTWCRVGQPGEAEDEAFAVTVQLLCNFAGRMRWTQPSGSLLRPVPGSQLFDLDGCGYIARGDRCSANLTLEVFHICNDITE